jgi:nitrogen fixation protein NifB
MDQSLKSVLAEHPCYDEEAHRRFARMHLPVAPRCNIQCNYCNRKYDCSNESRPGVTSEVLTPQQACDKVAFVYSQIPELRVIGIAGPGDPMANEATFETIRLVHERFPELTMCISTNGLALPENARRLYDLGVRFVTITMNACDPAIGERIYSFVTKDGKASKGREAAEHLLKMQTKGLEECVALGMVVKINIVMIPGINDSHIPDLVRYVKSRGAYTVNILPLIPVEGTAFEGLQAPTPEMRKGLMDRCGDLGIKVMRHCKQCRADAIGKLGDDRSAEFAGCGSCRTSKQRPILLGELREVVAVATDDGENVNRGFGNAPEFRIYSLKDGSELERVSVDLSAGVAGSSHREHISSVLMSLNAPKYIAVSEIGHYPEELITGQGIRPVVTKERIRDLLQRLS